MSQVQNAAPGPARVDSRALAGARRGEPERRAAAAARGPGGTQAAADPLARPVGADAFRVLAVLLVGWFHLWQQSWRSPGRIEPVVRTGYVWVDAMILLSAFCLFLPYAQARAKGLPFHFAEPGGAPSPPQESGRTAGVWAALRRLFASGGRFYAKRAVRILPAYFLNILFAAGMALTGGVVWDRAFSWDLFSHLTLTHTLCHYGYPHTQLNGVTWTVGVLAGFYLLFPLLAHAMAARPAQTAAGLLGIQAAYSVWALRCLDDYAYPAAFNRLPAFAGVLALGMGGALWLAKAGPALLAWRWGRPAGGLLALGAGWGVWQMQNWLSRESAIQRWQLAWRMPLALLFCALLLGVCLLQPPGRRVWSFLSGISYSFYLWHQVLAVWLKYRWRIPAWQGETPPNQLGDAAWSARYELLCWILAFAVALLSTYVVEKPSARRLRPLLRGNARTPAG